jgi:putative DNA primase/helicase
MAAGRTEEETEKRLGAALLAWQPLISIDNVNGELGGDALCQIIERPVVEIRSPTKELVDLISVMNVGRHARGEFLSQLATLGPQPRCLSP